jgi:hypothetical protein
MSSRSSTGSKKSNHRPYGSQSLFRSLRHQCDPLDREILERAFDAAWSAVKDNNSPLHFDSHEGLEAILRRELIAIVCVNGASDPETLRDIVLSRCLA